MAICIDLMELFIWKGMERAGEGQHDDIEDDELFRPGLALAGAGHEGLAKARLCAAHPHSR